MDNIGPNFYDLYDSIIQKIRELDSQSVITISIQKLQWISTKSNIGECQGWTPWSLFLVIKWALANVDNEAELRIALEKDIAEIVSEIHEMRGPADLALFQSNRISQFMRTLAHQQFWFQMQVSHEDIGRQYLLLNLLKNSYNIADKFKELTGISLEIFFIMSLYLKARFDVEEKNYFSLDYIPQVLREDFQKYLTLTALSPQEAASFCTEHLQKTKPHMQLHEQTPLSQKPLLQIKDEYVCYYPKLIDYYIKYGAYDLLKSLDSNFFSPALGRSLEKYIEMGLSFYGRQYLSEADLIKTLPQEEPKIDFIIPLSNANILIEAKAVEMHKMAKVNPDTLGSSLKDNIAKALIQAISVQNKIKEGDVSGLTPKECYIFIISYKELYLGPGERIWDEALKQSCHDYFKEKEIDYLESFDPSKVFIVPIDTFDAFITYTKHLTDEEIRSFLDLIVKNNQNAATAKFLFIDHLEGDVSDPLPHVKESAEKVWQEVFKYIQPIN